MIIMIYFWNIFIGVTGITLRTVANARGSAFHTRGYAAK